MLYLLIIPALIIIHYIFFCFFKVTRYEIKSVKIDKDIKILFLSDLHGFTYGNRLYNKIKELNPDFILIGGDSVNKNSAASFNKIKSLICNLPQIAPTYYAFGNHETQLKNLGFDDDRELKMAFNSFISELNANNVWLLYNEVEYMGNVSVMPIELPLEYYSKRKIKPYNSEEATGKIIGEFFVDNFNIILSHNPNYARNYAELNPDLILCGHTHGGLVRIPFVGAIISPELELFPKYSGGMYTVANGERSTKLIVSKGLGTHGFHIRVHDMAEIVEIRLISDKG